MKLNKKSTAIFILTAAMFTSIAATSISAKEAAVDVGIQTMAAGGGNVAQPMKEVTGYKYKWVDGIQYRRLWSYTYERWVDDHWSPVP